MTGEQERLYARAEMLEETGELAQAAAEVLTGAQGAGVDPRAVISLTAALQTLDPGAAAGYSAGSQKDRRDGTGYGSDGEFLEALSDAEDQVREHLCEVKELREQIALALDGAQQDLGQARRDLTAARAALAAAYAMGRGSHATAATAPAPPRSQRPRPPSPTPRPGSRTRNAGSVSARPPPTSSTPWPGGWLGRSASCGRYPRTSARSMS